MKCKLSFHCHVEQNSLARQDGRSWVRACSLCVRECVRECECECECKCARARVTVFLAMCRLWLEMLIEFCQDEGFAGGRHVLSLSFSRPPHSTRFAPSPFRHSSRPKYHGLKQILGAKMRLAQLVMALHSGTSTDLASF